MCQHALSCVVTPAVVVFVCCSVLDVEVSHTFTAPDRHNLVSESGLNGLTRILKQYDKVSEGKSKDHQQDKACVTRQSPG